MRNMEKINEVDKLNYQLGEYVGEHIYDHFLPTLNLGGGYTRTIINCTDDELTEYNTLSDDWFTFYQTDKTRDSQPWIDMTDFRRSLEIKYLPHILRCHLPRVNPTNMDLFLDGLINSLWHCDVCSYHLEKDSIEFTQDDYHTIINLKLQTKWDPWEKK